MMVKRHGGAKPKEPRERSGSRPAESRIPSPAQIRQLRLELGMSQPQFARSLGLVGKHRAQMVSRWERGLGKPNPSAIYIMRGRMRALRDRRELERVYLFPDEEEPF